VSVGDRFAFWKEPHSLEGRLKETQKCFNDGSPLRENQLITQPHRLHCPQPHRGEESWDTCSHGHTCRKGPTRSLCDSAAETPFPRQHECAHSPELYRKRSFQERNLEKVETHGKAPQKKGSREEVGARIETKEEFRSRFGFREIRAALELTFARELKGTTMSS